MQDTVPRTGRMILRRYARPYWVFHLARWRGRSNITFSMTVLLCSAIALPLAHAQSAPCGISSIQTVPPVLYPPVGKAARVQGTVIIMANFAPSGAVTATSVLRGPELLRKPATEAIRTWTANSYSGPRECPLVIAFELILPKVECDSTTTPEPAFIPKDSQHYVVRAGVVPICDRPMYVTKRHRLLHF
jgi:hypothetical protein